MDTGLQEHGRAELAARFGEIHRDGPIYVSGNEIRASIAIQIGGGDALGAVIVQEVTHRGVTDGKPVAESLQVIKKLAGSLLAKEPRQSHSRAPAERCSGKPPDSANKIIFHTQVHFVNEPTQCRFPKAIRGSPDVFECFRRIFQRRKVAITEVN